MEGIIKVCSFNEIIPLKMLSKESVDFKDNGKTVYIGYFEDDLIVGVVGYQWIGNKIRYKTDGVRKTHRNLGIYKKLFKYRDSICKPMKAKSITAFCTNKSVGTYIKNGFCIKKTNGNISFVERVNL